MPLRVWTFQDIVRCGPLSGVHECWMEMSRRLHTVRVSGPNVRNSSWHTYEQLKDIATFEMEDKNQEQATYARSINGAHQHDPK